MNFFDVVNDIKKLIGMELESVRPGARITIIAVDDEKGSIIIRTSTGQVRSRPIEELNKIWKEMMLVPAVHVDGVLHGSGTSRNQPETILANLPYIEWLKLNNKKHLSYVGKNTHAFGTLRQMDALQSVEISAKIKKSNSTQQATSVVVAKDINSAIQIIQSMCTGTLSTVDIGFYQLQSQNNLIFFLSADIWKLDEGVYCLLEADSYTVASDRQICLMGINYSVLCNGVVKAFVKISK